MTRQGEAEHVLIAEGCGTFASGLFLGTPLLVASTFRDGDHHMGQWLIADVSQLDVHLQLWMLLVTGIMVLWIICVWATQLR